ncbi:unnamed protein product, partial [Larinioides sclopetarius]
KRISHLQIGQRFSLSLKPIPYRLQSIQSYSSYRVLKIKRAKLLVRPYKEKSILSSILLSIRAVKIKLGGKDCK